MCLTGSRQSQRKARGFGYSLVEVIVVIAVASILTVSILSRTSNHEFERVLVGDALLSAGRLAQQRALGRQNVSLSLQLSSETLTLGTKISGTLRPSAVLTGIEYPMTLGAVADITNISCGSLTTLSNFDLDFDSLGEVAHALGFQICFNQSPIVCITSAGFAHEGQCE